MKPTATRTFTLAALIAIGAAFSPLPAMAQDFQVYIGSAPPAPIYEHIPGPRHGYVWAPGYWEWRGHRHSWVRGHWVAARPGYAYAAPHWRQRHGRWYMEPAHWTRHEGRDRGYHQRRGYEPVYAGGYRDDRGYRHDRGYRDDRAYYRDRRGYRDTDRDGIPNRYDRDLDNDGVRNRHDRDRDGDGVPNRHDARPNNPYRY